jgi:DNA end-binding protein Ku
MRTTWNGSLSFGLVTIPVGLAPATTPKARASDVTFRTLHRECQTPIKQKRWCPVHEREVPNDELVKGWEVSKGQFVIVEDADLEAIEQRDTSRAIEISRFVPLSEVDPMFFDRTYFLAPSSAEAQRRPYVLLLNAMKETGMAAIGRMVIRGNENFVLIRPKGEALVLETLFLAEDVRSQAEIEEAVEAVDVKEPELDLARQLIDSLVGEWEPDALQSEYRQSLRELLEAKLAGEAGAGGGCPGGRPDGSAQEERRGVEAEGWRYAGCAQEGSAEEARRRRTQVAARQLPSIRRGWRRGRRCPR